MTARPPTPIGRLPVPPGARSILLIGGTFDPPHTAHVSMAVEAAATLHLERLLFIPAARSPHKDAGPEASDQDRLAMLALALDGVANASISTIEINAAHGPPGERSAPSYTVDTIRALRAALPAASLRLLIGADQAAQFHRWREPREIIALAEPAVVLREPYATSDQLIAAMAPHWPAADLAAWRTRILGLPTVGISATTARDILRTRGAESPALAGLLHPAVREYIRERTLYRGG